MKLARCLACALVSLSLLSCGEKSAAPEGGDCTNISKPGCVVLSAKQRVTTPGVTNADFAELTSDNTAFAFDLYHQLDSRPGNFLFSPISVSIAFAMVSAGARGQTASEIAKALHFTLPASRLHPAMDALDLDLENLGRDDGGAAQSFRLDLANSEWGQINFPYEAPFLDTLAQYYGAGMRVVDFIHAPDQARGLINKWVSGKTAGRIANLLQKNDIQTDTRLVLVNAVYFKAAWATQFDKSKTASGSFTRPDGTPVTVPLMHLQTDMSYAEGADFQAVDIPYKGNKVRMLVIAPKAGQLGSFETSFDSARLAAILGAAKYQTVALTLPRFHIDSSYRLKSAFEALGIHLAFSPTGTADFSGITKAEALYIKHVIQDALVSTDEDGTEATASTAVVFAEASIDAAAPKIIQLDVTRPFLVVIHDVATGTVLFAGRVTDPSG